MCSFCAERVLVKSPRSLWRMYDSFACFHATTGRLVQRYGNIVSFET